MEMENVFYIDYNGRIQISFDALIMGMWNVYVEYEGGDNKIFLNNKEFFENSFDNAYDAAWAATLSGRWDWKDAFVYFSGEGYITSFSHWDDKNSPINLDKIDISHIIQALQDMQTNDKRYVVNSIPRAIHDALKEE